MINKKTPPLPDIYGNNRPCYYIYIIMSRNIFISLLALTQNNGFNLCKIQEFIKHSQNIHSYT